MIDRSQLGGFTGTEKWHKWSPLFPRVVLTDGAKYVAESGGQHGAYWLMDAIASYQPEVQKKRQLRDFQLWTLCVDDKDKTAVLTCQEDSDKIPTVIQEIEHTDFDLPEMRMYCMPTGDGKSYVILLPSEY
jgi:hypothetical protein